MSKFLEFLVVLALYVVLWVAVTFLFVWAANYLIDYFALTIRHLNFCAAVALIFITSSLFTFKLPKTNEK